jgi:uncharacterized surface protein with fasciclin (FAS1) repeats
VVNFFSSTPIFIRYYSQVVSTFAQQNFTIGLTGGAKITNASGRVSNIVATDVQYSNGIIHVIDKVLLPKF